MDAAHLPLICRRWTASAVERRMATTRMVHARSVGGAATRTGESPRRWREGGSGSNGGEKTRAVQVEDGRPRYGYRVQG